MKAEELLKHARKFTFTPNLPHWHHSDEVHVEWRSEDRWVVVFGGDVLNTEGLLEYEPSPSHRDEAFLARTRFPLAQAIELAQQLVKKVENGRSSVRYAL
ncbi:conserved hypothetical protein [Virus Rctr197k]|nr:conserved hypothetical protein [Virus Rctr197k]